MREEVWCWWFGGRGGGQAGRQAGRQQQPPACTKREQALGEDWFPCARERVPV